MTYEQIRNIDPKAEGKIKATYAMLYNKEGKKLFALQREDCGFNESLKPDVSLIFPAGKNSYFVADKASLNLQKEQANSGEKKISASENVIDFRWDMPVVKAIGADGERIQVRLIKEAVELIRTKTEKPKYTWYKVLASCEKVNWGDWFSAKEIDAQTIYEGYDYPANDVLDQTTIGKQSLKKLIYDVSRKFSNKGKGGSARSRFLQEVNKIYNGDQFEVIKWLAEKGYISAADNELKAKYPTIYFDIKTILTMDQSKYSPEYEELLSKLDTNSIFYVNPNAFDWNATTVNNATIEREENGKVISVNLDDAINEAKEKYDKAKAILAVAGSTIIF